MSAASKLATESATKLDGVNNFVFVLNIIGSVILIIFGFIPVEEPFCSGYFCDDGLFNIQFSVIGVALFLGALLTFRLIDAFTDQIRVKVDILEELRKGK